MTIKHILHLKKDSSLKDIVEELTECKECFIKLKEDDYDRVRDNIEELNEFQNDILLNLFLMLYPNKREELLEVLASNINRENCDGTVADFTDRYGYEYLEEYLESYIQSKKTVASTILERDLKVSVKEFLNECYGMNMVIKYKNMLIEYVYNNILVNEWIEYEFVSAVYKNCTFEQKKIYALITAQNEAEVIMNNSLEQLLSMFSLNVIVNDIESFL